MIKRILLALVGLAIVGGAAFFGLTIPKRLDAAEIAPEAAGDAVRGEVVFWAGGCASCHAPTKAEGEAKLALGGGDPLKTPVGIFHAPNISPDPANGLGAWSFPEFANALQRGVGRDGSHLYPAFPYTSYSRMTPGDVADLWAYLKTLPPVEGAAPANELAFPFNLRRGIGLWKLAFLDPAPVVVLPTDASDAVRRGHYLAEGPSHCGECHTPRLFGGFGGSDKARWLAGGPSPEGDGKVPNITPSEAGIGSWSQSDIAEFFESGFTPDFDTVGGSMVEVQQNLARLPAADREAIAAYLKAVPPL